MKTRQRDFFDRDREYGPRRKTYGGAEQNGLRKIKRPLDHRRPVHLLLKSSHARAKLSMLSGKNRLEIKALITKWAAKFSIKIHGMENMGNHLHIIATFPRREAFADFLRTITSLIARKITGARKGRPFGKRFWDDLAFTRVITGWRDVKGVKNYLGKNAVERDVGPMARRTIEEYEEARRLASRRGVDVWEILEAPA